MIDTHAYIAGLEARGYKRHHDPFHSGKRGHVGFWQRRLIDAQGVKYFINVNVYDYGQLTNGLKLGAQVQAEVQFNTRDNTEGTYVNIGLWADDIAAAEDHFERIWATMGYGYYKTEPADTVGTHAAAS